MQVMQVYQGV